MMEWFNFVEAILLILWFIAILIGLVFITDVTSDAFIKYIKILGIFGVIILLYLFVTAIIVTYI